MSRFAGKPVFAKGRMRAGEMNQTEQRFARWLEEQKRLGSVAEYWFEPVSLKVAPNRCSYTPDFGVLRPSGEFEFFEVKGSPAIFQDDSKVKIKVCAGNLPFRITVAFPVPAKKGGGWRFQEF